MSGRVLYSDLVNSPEQVTLKFRFQVQAGGADNDPDVILPHKCGVTDVTNEAVGQYRITFAEKFPVFIGMVGSVLEATPTHDLIVKCDVADYNATNGTLDVYVVGADGTTAAEEPADNDWVYCEVTFCRRSELAPSGAI